MRASFVSTDAPHSHFSLLLCYPSHPFLSSATLAGLRTRSAANPANPPIYIHISGAGILEDNARGELLTPTHIWHDTEMDLRALKDVTHIVSDLEIVKAGTRVENRIRTMILFPGWIYGAVGFHVMLSAVLISLNNLQESARASRR